MAGASGSSGSKIGRPCEFNEAIADAICERLANAESLRKICLDDSMPSQATVFRWLADERFSAFKEQYTRAREAQADALFDEILDIADDGSNDFMGEDEKYNGDAVQRSRLRVDARKWMAGKLRPKVYGDKALGDPENPVHVVNTIRKEIIDPNAG
jgi:hypothetical protein